MIIGSWHPSVALTYAGAAASAFGAYLAVTGNLTGAVACLVVAGLADLFDGPLARAMTRTDAQRAFGVQVDSMADVFSFVAFPVVLVAALVGRWWVVPVLVAYAVAGLARLTHFTVAATVGAPAAGGGSAPAGATVRAADPGPTGAPPGDAPARRSFRGLPVTYAALVLPLVALLRPYTGSAFGPLLTAVTGLLAVAFVLDAPVAKPRGAAYGVLGLVAVGVLVGLAVGGV